MRTTTVIIVLIWVAVAVLFMAYSSVERDSDTTVILMDAYGDTVTLSARTDTLEVGLIVRPDKKPTDSQDTAVAINNEAETIKSSQSLKSKEHRADTKDLLCVEINSADSQKLTKLPGIGPVLAQRILEQRTLIGSFNNSQDLLEVKGIGPSRLDRIKEHICF